MRFKLNQVHFTRSANLKRIGNQIKTQTRDSFSLHRGSFYCMAFALHSSKSSAHKVN